MASIKIIKGSVRNVVDEVQFEKLYKPNGWKIDEFADEKQPNESIKDLKTQTELKNYTQMKRQKTKKFNDKLFYSETEN